MPFEKPEGPVFMWVLLFKLFSTSIYSSLIVKNFWVRFPECLPLLWRESSNSHLPKLR